MDDSRAQENEHRQLIKSAEPLAGLRQAGSNFLAVPEGERSTGSIILWWEKRRIPYNIAVCAAGIVTLAIASAVAHASISTMTVACIPLIIMWVVGANVCYTAGWIGELCARFLFGQQLLARFGPVGFTLGLIFSVIATLGISLISLLLF